MASVDQTDRTAGEHRIVTRCASAPCDDLMKLQFSRDRPWLCHPDGRVAYLLSTEPEGANDEPAGVTAGKLLTELRIPSNHVG